VGHTGVIFDYEVRQQRLLQVGAMLCCCNIAGARAPADATAEFLQGNLAGSSICSVSTKLTAECCPAGPHKYHFLRGGERRQEVACDR